MFTIYLNSKKKRLCAFSPKSRKIGIHVSKPATHIDFFEKENNARNIHGATTFGQAS